MTTDKEPKLYDLRCLYVDYSRESDEPGEVHHRCRHRLAFQPDADGRTPIYCGMHSSEELTGESATKREIKEAQLMAERLAAVHKMPNGKMGGLNEEETIWAARMQDAHLVPEMDEVVHEAP